MKLKTNEELKVCMDRLLASGKPVILAARFKTVNELEEKHIKHFKYAEYLWEIKEREPGLLFGILLDEELNYVHAVLASKEVLNFIFEKVNQ